MLANRRADADLLTVFHNTPRDLQSNRLGRISYHQRQRIRRMIWLPILGQILLIGLLFFPVVFAFGGIWIIRSRRLIVLIGMIFTGLLLMYMRLNTTWDRARTLNQDLYRHRVQVVQGYARLLDHRQVRIGGKVFSLTRQQQAVLNNNTVYTVYYLPHSREVMGIVSQSRDLIA